MARFTTLYSGSSGNAAIAEHDGRFLLIDMGASCRATVNALASIGLSPQNLSGILVTHEHSDHIKGLNVFLKKHSVPLYASAATLDVLDERGIAPPATEMIAVDGRCEDIDGFMVEGFSTSHDAAGCCGFRIQMPDGTSMALATDLGVMTDEVYHHLSSVQMVALEANYDLQELRTGPYPYYLKKRIESPYGHLSNTDSAATVASLVANGCRRVALCHLSEQNNTPSMVRRAMDSAFFSMGMPVPEDCILQVSRRHEVSPWIEF